MRELILVLDGVS